MNYIEDLYKRGYLPETYYNQLNGKTAQENYNEIKTRQTEERKNQFFFSAEKYVDEKIEKALFRILKELNL